MLCVLLESYRETKALQRKHFLPSPRSLALRNRDSVIVQWALVICNSDQGSHFVSSQYLDLLKELMSRLA
jgi:hypothetical protein